MPDLLKIPAARDWIDHIIKNHSTKAFGELKTAVIWTDAKDKNGHLLVPIDPINLVAQINTDPFILLNGHDPGKPIGKIIKSANFESRSGEKFIAAILGFYAGGKNLEFKELDLDISKTISPPAELPTLPNNICIDFATDPREVDPEWLEQVTCNAPIHVRHSELSHNSADVIQELIRVGLPYLVIVWNPFVKAIASEAGKDIYAALNKWVRQLLTKLAKRHDPILSIQSFQQNCQVSFLFRGKNIELLYVAHDSLSNAAVQAAQLINKLKARDMPVRELIYEFDKEALKWYPSYAILNDDRIVTDSSKLIAIEQLSTELSLGITIN
ncbi:hypothetical protein [Pragia fontium]|uniref:hypothetical protein n=1 Tax=Pragia fontium TaxID=82985 RepID=UPI00064A7F38|nr:hypothetical protein [Pragia fontium]AKJ43524.1 hypothetical protein QQ39_16890 [Pragia fontium]